MLRFAQGFDLQGRVEPRSICSKVRSLVRRRRTLGQRSCLLPFKKKRDIMNLQIFFQLAAILFIVGAGPLVVVLLASRGGNL